jgi:hypothetical protein
VLTVAGVLGDKVRAEEAGVLGDKVRAEEAETAGFAVEGFGVCCTVFAGATFCTDGWYFTIELDLDVERITSPGDDGTPG